MEEHHLALPPRKFLKHAGVPTTVLQACFPHCSLMVVVVVVAVEVLVVG